MKILIDGRVLKHQAVTGVERYTIEISQHLKNFSDIKVAIPKFSNRFYQHLWEHLILPFRSRKYDLLFSPANIAPIWKPKNTKLVMTLHDNAFITHPKSVSKLFFYYYKYAIPRALKIADRVITISEFSKSEIIKTYPFVKDKIEVIYNGIDAHKFSPLGHEDNERYVLFVGSLNSRKNIMNLIKAFDLISSKHDIKLKIVGNFSDIFSLSKEEQEVLQHAKEDKKIIFLENIDNNELVQLYQKAIIFVFPSTYEGFGLPPLEAMACGTAVISSNSASLPEVCGDAVLYIDPYDIKDIADKMSTLIEDKKLQNVLIEKGSKRVKQFTWEASVDRHLELFKKVLKK